MIDVRKRCHAGIDPAYTIGETPDQVRGDSQADGDHMGALYFGDNLHVLREEIRDETIDLIYLDPPFNSKRDYNVFLKTPKGHESDAQITAFEDSWHWGEQAEREFSELLKQPNTDVAEMIQSLRRFLKESDMMAYRLLQPLVR